MRKGYGNYRASAAAPGKSNSITPCSTSQESVSVAIIASRYPFARIATVVAMASMGLEVKRDGQSATASTRPQSHSAFGWRV